MNIEQKLDYFTEAMFNEAAAAQRRAETKRTAQAEEAVASALEAARARIQEAERQAAHESKIARYKQIAAASAKARRDLHILRQRLLEALFSEAERELRRFADSEAYRGYLEKHIHAISGFSVVLLTQKDADMGIKLPEGLVTEVIDADQSQNDPIGGFILLNANRTLRVDCTLRTRLAAVQADSEYGA